MNYTIKSAIGLDNIPEARQIRIDVFVKEQNFEYEFDDIDNTAEFIVLFDKDLPIATGRLYESDGVAVIGRIAVIKSYRKKGVGSIVVSTLEELAKKRNLTLVRLSAQVRASDFYRSLGYVSYGEEYLEEYCPHIAMKKGIIV